MKILCMTLLATILVGSTHYTLSQQMMPPTSHQMERTNKSCLKSILGDPANLSDEKLECRYGVTRICGPIGGTLAFAAVLFPCALLGPGGWSIGAWMAGMTGGSFGAAASVVVPSLVMSDYYHTEIYKRKAERKRLKKENYVCVKCKGSSGGCNANTTGCEKESLLGK